jgi:hypothetical protein
MSYPVQCDCGQVQRVPGTLAGSLVTCRCGRQVRVPPLSRLKQAVGETVLSPQVRIEQMLRLGLLPEETRCVVCGAPTEGTVRFWATCERVSVQEEWGAKGWQLVAFILCFGWVGALLAYRARRGDGAREHGRDVQFRLPLRVCPGCAPGLADAVALRDAVWAVPLYAGLLERYPDAVLVPDDPRKGINLSAPGT